MGFFLAYDSRMHCVSLIRNFKLKMYIFESRIAVCLCYRKNQKKIFFGHGHTPLIDPLV